MTQTGKPKFSLVPSSSLRMLSRGDSPIQRLIWRDEGMASEINKVLTALIIDPLAIEDMMYDDKKDPSILHVDSTLYGIWLALGEAAYANALITISEMPAVYGIERAAKELAIYDEDLATACALNAILDSIGPYRCAFVLNNGIADQVMGLVWRLLDFVRTPPAKMTALETTPVFDLGELALDVSAQNVAAETGVRASPALSGIGSASLIALAHAARRYQDLRVYRSSMEDAIKYLIDGIMGCMGRRQYGWDPLFVGRAQAGYERYARDTVIELRRQSAEFVAGSYASTILNWRGGTSP